MSQEMYIREFIFRCHECLLRYIIRTISLKRSRNMNEHIYYDSSRGDRKCKMIPSSFLERTYRGSDCVITRLRKIIYKHAVFSSTSSRPTPMPLIFRSLLRRTHIRIYMCALSFLIELKHFPNAIPFHPWHVAEVFIYKYRRRRLCVGASARESRCRSRAEGRGWMCTTRRCFFPFLSPLRPPPYQSPDPRV